MEGIPDIEGFRQRAKARSERNWEAHLHGKLTPDDVLSCTAV
jgi:hypothetical protein